MFSLFDGQVITGSDVVGFKVVVVVGFLVVVVGCGVVVGVSVVDVVVLVVEVDASSH